MTELNKMLAGKIYDPNDDELATMRTYAHKMCNRYNKTDEDDPARNEILKCCLTIPTAFIYRDPFTSTTESLQLSAKTVTPTLTLPSWIARP